MAKPISHPALKKIAIDYIDNKTNHKLHIPAFKKPINAKEYASLENILDELIDVIRDNEKHPLTTVMQIISENKRGRISSAF